MSKSSSSSPNGLINCSATFKRKAKSSEHEQTGSKNSDRFILLRKRQYLQPTHVEKELQQSEDGYIHIILVVGITFGGI